MGSKKAADCEGRCGFGCYYGNELIEMSKKAARYEGGCRVIATARKATALAI